MCPLTSFSPPSRPRVGVNVSFRRSEVGPRRSVPFDGSGVGRPVRGLCRGEPKTVLESSFCPFDSTRRTISVRS